MQSLFCLVTKPEALRAMASPQGRRMNHLEVGAKEPQFGGKCDGIHPKYLGHIPTRCPHCHLCSFTQTSPLQVSCACGLF